VVSNNRQPNVSATAQTEQPEPVKPFNDQAPVRHDVILAMQEPTCNKSSAAKRHTNSANNSCPAQSNGSGSTASRPTSSIEYICEILPARTRGGPDDAPLEGDGVGNKEFNVHHKDREGYDYAYKIQSVYRLDDPLTLAKLQSIYGMNSAPRGLVYTPASIVEQVDWRKAVKIR
jgi:hypothetical protein